ncbi:hypothetical protein [Klebsiella pneumoniae]|uniref:hypothetical protein n=1 Tax=Klebsiella pneumoniae TaxID=573 RepID=UPI001F2F7C9B|nr:hypothetical protein [Klebsiella pneumoniae]MCE7493487.1 hypothetical protein [Klebsiella pneumoniae]MCE7503985.1 hypothetical protein [Klebsiella pneumoniae]MCQ8640811.1 hypothetical protein [Klebsiella pneumoniae]
MIQLNLARVLLLGNERNGYIRYEIFSKEGENPNYPEKIIVYRECAIGEHGECGWLKTNDEVSLEHLGFQPGGGFQRAITYHMRPARDMASAMGECRRHYQGKYGSE